MADVLAAQREALARAAAADLSPRASKVLGAVLALTTSYERTSVEVGPGEIAPLAGLSLRSTQRGLRELRERFVITYQPGNGRARRSRVEVPGLTVVKRSEKGDRKGDKRVTERVTERVTPLASNRTLLSLESKAKTSAPARMRPRGEAAAANFFKIFRKRPRPLRAQVADELEHELERVDMADVVALMKERRARGVDVQSLRYFLEPIRELATTSLPLSPVARRDPIAWFEGWCEQTAWRLPEDAVKCVLADKGLLTDELLERVRETQRIKLAERSPVPA